jgi:hypothetical protein
MERSLYSQLWIKQSTLPKAPGCRQKRDWLLARCAEGLLGRPEDDAEVAAARAALLGDVILTEKVTE